MFKGPWKVSSNTVIEGSNISLGDIIKHKSGAIILKCPKCGALQFTHSPVIGDNDTPTLTKRIQCGSGFCKRCAIWFSIQAGKTVLHDGKEESNATLIPQKLIDAGIHKAPTIEED